MIDKEKILKEIELEEQRFTNYYTLISTIANNQIKELLGLNETEELTLEQISKVHDKLNEEDKTKYDAIKSNIDNCRLETEISLRTLAWVKELINPKKEEDSES